MALVELELKSNSLSRVLQRQQFLPETLPRVRFALGVLPRHGTGQNFCRDTLSIFSAMTRIRSGLDSSAKTGITFASELRFRRLTYQIAQGKKFYPTKFISVERGKKGERHAGFSVTRGGDYVHLDPWRVGICPVCFG